MNYSGLKILTWQDPSSQNWIAVYHDAGGKQVGIYGYGSTVKQAIGNISLIPVELLEPNHE